MTDIRCETGVPMPEKKALYKSTILNHFLLTSDYETSFLSRYGQSLDEPQSDRYQRHQYHLTDFLPRESTQGDKGELYGKRGTWVVEVWFREDMLPSCQTQSEADADYNCWDSFHDDDDKPVSEGGTCSVEYLCLPTRDDR